MTQRVLTDSKSYAEIFGALLGSVYDGFADYLDKADEVPPVEDPMLGNNVAHNWERDDFEAFMRRIEESRKWAERALNQDDEEQAVKLWQKVFGEEWFPTTAQLKGESLRAAVISGSVFVTPSGRVQTQKPEGRSIQSPPQRFYGKD